jgi:hypothetical protein
MTPVSPFAGDTRSTGQRRAMNTLFFPLFHRVVTNTPRVWLIPANRIHTHIPRPATVLERK